MTRDQATEAAAADFQFRRPLLLTARQDLLGYVGSLLGRALLFLVAASSVLAVLLILVYIVAEAIPFLIAGETLSDMLAHLWARLGEILTRTAWHPQAEPPQFGVLAIIVGTLYVTITALAIAVPIGLMTAMCLSDIMSFTLRQFVKPVVEVLAAIPSVAYGFFALMVVVPALQNWFGMSSGKNVLNGGLMLAIMAIPTIVSVSEDSLTAVGRELREASYGLGATRAETLLKVVVPAAHNGIIAAVILGMMRAIGETMVVLMATGMAAQVPDPWYDLTQSVRTMTATIAQEMGETVQGSVHYRCLFTIGLLLLLFTFGLNLVTEALLGRMRGKGATSS